MPGKQDSESATKKITRRAPRKKKEEAESAAPPWQEEAMPAVEQGLMIYCAGREYKLPMTEKERVAAWVSIKQKIPRGVAVELCGHVFIGPMVAKRY